MAREVISDSAQHEAGSNMIELLSSSGASPLMWGIVLVTVAAAYSLLSFLGRRLAEESDIEKVFRTKSAENREIIETIDVVSQIKSKNLHNKTEKELIDLLSTSFIELVKDARPYPNIDELISKYHNQGISQAYTQFLLGVVASAVGFIWFLYYASEFKVDDISTAFKPLASILTTVIAVLFFKQSTATRRWATDLYDRLRNDKKLTEATAMVATIDDERIRNVIKAQIACHMAGLDPTPIDVASLLASASVQPRGELTFNREDASNHT